tara:strand:- start:11 stop:799 length:789 start_codon:yes stop_codon:yes gene_type:complete
MRSYIDPLPRSTQNSVESMIDALRRKPFLSENELTWAAFDYDRNISGHSNKKYADMLRRGLRKGIIKRVEAKVKGKRATFFYYIPDQEDMVLGNFHPDSLVKEDKFDELRFQKADIKELINCIVKTHNNYTMWENSEISDVDFILNLLEIVSDYSVRKVIPFYGNGWVMYLRDNLNNELPKNSSGSFYTSLIDFDNFFLDGMFENMLEQDMLEPTDERVDYLSEFAWREYDKIRPSLYTNEPIVDYEQTPPTYIGAPGNELV